MMILHALIGYLTVTALPFTPFAFASPLAAIEFDGWVNTTQNYVDGALMKHVLGNIVGTCQTVTTQNHKDSALVKRLPGDIIEARQAEYAIPVVVVIEIMVDVTVIFATIADSNKVRGNDVEFLVNTLIEGLPPETCGVYPRHYHQGRFAVSKI